ncbi:hypothetical protein BVG19_g4695 [[Candida] boidinii]|nr:hypothetical protein BVG19_g4695 [[Candida] boidinii]OWB53343.1 hypothetical protein B5S27_g4937 [[Candida] boidinii]
MNHIRQVQKLNEEELKNGTSISASWHQEYNDTSYIYIGSLPFEVTELDILTIFSQYGVPTDLKMARDEDSGKSKGFCFLKYEDQRSTVLAVDNLNGVQVGSRLIRVDHARYKPPKEAETEEAEVGEVGEVRNNLAQQYQDMVDDELKRDFANVESEDEIAKYKDADKIRYNPRNDPINNSKFNSLQSRNEIEVDKDKDKDNDNDHIEDEEEDEFEDPMAKFLENKEKTMNKKRTIDDQKSYKSNRNTGSKSNRRSHRHHHHHHKHSRNRSDKQAKTSDSSYSEK